MKQGDVIRSGRLEAVPHLPGLGCVIWGRKKAVAGSFARSAVSLGQRGGVGRQAGAQAATANPPPGAAEEPLMTAPGVGGLRLGRGFPRVAAVASYEAAAAAMGGGRGDEALPHPAPPRGGGGHGAAGPNPGQERGGAAVAAPSAAASAAAAPADAGAAATGLILLRLKAAATARTRPAAALRHAAVRSLVPPPALGGVGGSQLRVPPSPPPLLPSPVPSSCSWACVSFCFCDSLRRDSETSPASPVPPQTHCAHLACLSSYLCAVLTVFSPPSAK